MSFKHKADNGISFKHKAGNGFQTQRTWTSKSDIRNINPPSTWPTISIINVRNQQPIFISDKLYDGNKKERDIGTYNKKK